MDLRPRLRFDINSLTPIYEAYNDTHRSHREITWVSFEEVTANIRSGMYPVIMDMGLYTEFLRETAAYEIMEMSIYMVYDMVYRSERFDNPYDKRYMQHLYLFCVGVNATTPEPMESIMFALIKAFVTVDRTMTADDTYFKFGQDDDDFVSMMIEKGAEDYDDDDES